MGVDYQGGSPLHYAAHFQQAGATRVLLENHSDINLQDANGESPLHCAITTGSNKRFCFHKQFVDR